MTRHFSRDHLTYPEGRKALYRSLMLDDHGILRVFYNNTHCLAPGKMWRSYQPSPAHLEKWKKRGIRTIINLRGETPSGHYVLEEEACEKLKLKLVNFRVYSREAPSPEIIHGAYNLFSSIEYPAMMHCKSGADRAGMMSVLYLFFHEAIPLDEAIRQLQFRYGHVRHGKTGVIDYAFARYLAHAQGKNLNLSDISAFLKWVDTDYDPTAIKKEFMGNWWGNLLTERLLRRE